MKVCIVICLVAVFVSCIEVQGRPANRQKRQWNEEEQEAQEMQEGNEQQEQQEAAEQQEPNEQRQQWTAEQAQEAAEAAQEAAERRLEFEQEERERQLELQQEARERQQERQQERGGAMGSSFSSVFGMGPGGAGGGGQPSWAGNPTRPGRPTQRPWYLQENQFFDPAAAPQMMQTLEQLILANMGPAAQVAPAAGGGTDSDESNEGVEIDGQSVSSSPSTSELSVGPF